MDSTHNSSCSETGSPITSVPGHNEDCDEVDELLLLQIAQADDPVSPRLNAAIDVLQERIQPMEHQIPPSSLVQRPKSSGIDITAFSFAKPLQHGKEFSLKPAVKPQATSALNGVLGQDEAECSNVNGSRREENTPRVITDDQSPPVSHSTSETLTQGARPMEYSKNPFDQVEGRRESDVSLPAANEESSHSVTGSQRRRYYESHAGYNSSRLSKARPDERSGVADVTTPEVPDVLHSTRRANGEFRIAKPHRTRRANAKGPPKIPRNKDTQLSEEDIFQLLINRLKMREENEAAATSLQRQMETHIANLQEENNALKHELETLGTQLEKQSAEAKTHRSRQGLWKKKLARFKHFLNELGSDYKNIRGDAIQLRAARSACDKERKIIAEDISDLKSRLAQTTSVVNTNNSRSTEMGGMITLLRKELKNADEKAVYTQQQLSKESKRNASLESYIRSHSIYQAKGLELVKAGQIETSQKLDSAFERIRTEWESSQRDVHSALGRTLEECLDLLRGMEDKRVLERADVQTCQQTAIEFTSQMNSITAQLTEEINRSASVNGGTAHILKEQLQIAYDTVGTGSTLLEKFTENDKSFCSVQQRLGDLISSVEKVNESLTGFGLKENYLADEMGRLGKSLSEVKIPENIATFPAEGYFSIDEKRHLEATIETLRADLVLTGESVDTKDTEIESLKLSMSTVTEKLQQEEQRTIQLTVESDVLKHKIEEMDTKVREQLSRASVIARDQTKARFEQQMHQLSRGNADLELHVENLQGQLRDVEKKLEESKLAAKKERDDLECLVLEKEKKIHSLENSRTDDATKLAEKEVEIEKLRELETTNALEQADLQLRLEVASKKNSDFETELAEITDKNLALSNDQQDKIESLQKETLKQSEMLEGVQKELHEANATRSTLESGKAKAKDEIHALLRRVQSADESMRKIKEMIERTGTAIPDEPFSETVTRLEKLLLSARATESLDTSTTHMPNGTTAGMNPDAAENIGLASSPILGGTAGQDLVQTTEVIYRTQSVQRNVASMSMGMNELGSDWANGKTACVPDSQPPSKIVPFSSIRQQLSPVPGSTPDSCDRSMAALFTMPDQTVSGPASVERNGGMGENLPRRDDKDASGSNTKPASTKGEEHKTPVKPRAVTFTASQPSASGESHRPQSVSQTASSRSVETNKPRPRANRRTYGKIRQSAVNTSSRSQPQNASPAVSRNSSHLGNLGPLQTKKTKHSHDSTPRVPQRAPEYLERKASPAKLASGSSRPGSMNENQGSQKLPGRMTRGRRTRGKACLLSIGVLLIQ
ncbi:hypothetical protein BDW42DRAFT_181388 [Aspergillus taichungensis]|uniref:Rootletin n=1 Tax=Aspergillus taichungensis TaxID=482145 RepID=A0A2J5HDZ6_9EURO|nr:hypothetical protein BDW42DRAFT_181388 [Aspergillus taichungensis]